MGGAETAGTVAWVLVALLAASGPTGSARATERGVRGPAAALDAARGAVAEVGRRSAATDKAAGAALGTDSAPVVQRVERTPPEAAAPVQAEAGSGEATGQPVQQSTYDAARHRDPFRPPRLSSTASAGATTPLERYQLGQLKLVGIVWDSAAARAMVEDSAGLGYIVTTGTPIGSSGGVVRKIEPRRVVIQERVTNFYGEQQPKEIVMELPEEDRSP